MTNIRLMSIEQYKDVSSKNNYYSYHLKDDEQSRLHRIHLSSRDSSRTPMQWDDSEYAGFSTVAPWFGVNPNYRAINVKKQEAESDSILNFYRACIRLRNSSPALLYGEYREHNSKEPNIYSYSRSLDGEVYLIICSFFLERLPYIVPKQFRGMKARLLLTNYPAKRETGMEFEMPHTGFRVYPYEALVIRIS